MPLCRAICTKFELSTPGTFDMVFRRLVKRLVGTKRMLIFDEAERLHYKALETIRDRHDETGRPVLLTGKPNLYERLVLQRQARLLPFVPSLGGGGEGV